MRKLSFPGKIGKIYTLGIFLVCGLLLISAEECEDISMADQQAAWARYQAGQSGPDQAAAWAQSQAAQSGPDQAAAWSQNQASQSGPDQAQAFANQNQASGSQAENTGPSQAAPAASVAAAGADPAASGPTAGGSQAAASGPTASGAPAASGPSASQAAAGAQGNSGASAQGQQQAASGSQSGGAAQVAGTGDGASGGSASQSGTGADGTTPASANQSQAAGSTATNFLTAISGKEWKLSELRLTGKTIALDRSKLNADGAGDIFTMTVEGNRISGKAAPNRYNTVYQAGANNTLTLSPVVSTLMASSFDPERIQEHEYYQYLSKVKSWRLNQNKLELYTTDTGNKEAVLVYVN